MSGSSTVPLKVYQGVLHSGRPPGGRLMPISGSSSPRLWCGTHTAGCCFLGCFPVLCQPDLLLGHRDPMTRSLSPCLKDEDWQAQVIDTLFTHLLKIGALPALYSALRLPGGQPWSLEMLTPRLPIQVLGSCRRSQSEARIVSVLLGSHTYSPGEHLPPETRSQT